MACINIAISDDVVNTITKALIYRMKNIMIVSIAADENLNDNQEFISLEKALNVMSKASDNLLRQKEMLRKR